MSERLAILSLGHTHRTDTAELYRGQGAQAHGLSERALIRGYVEPLRAGLLTRGWEVAETFGSLSGRQARAADLIQTHLRAYPSGLAVYLACHVNAGPGGTSPSLVLYDERSLMGRAAAESVARRCGLRGRVQGTHAGDWTSRAWNTIRGIWSAPAGSCGLCLEPLDLNDDADRALLTPEHLKTVGEALAYSLSEWARGHERVA